MDPPEPRPRRRGEWGGLRVPPGSRPPTVSVVMPVRDAARWLHEAMASLLAQSWPRGCYLTILVT